MNEPVINPNGRGVSTQSTSTLKDLVYNPETGDFEQVERGTANEGDTVTRLTEDGFAHTLRDGFTANEAANNEIIDGLIINGNSVTNHKNLVYNPETDEFEQIATDNDDTVLNDDNVEVFWI